MAHAALWGVAAAIVHIIPYAGSAVTIVAVGIAAFVQFEDIARALTVAFCVGLAATVIGMPSCPGTAREVRSARIRVEVLKCFTTPSFFLSSR